MAANSCPNDEQLKAWARACHEGGPAKARERGLSWVEIHIYVTNGGCPNCKARLGPIGQQVKRPFTDNSL